MAGMTDRLSDERLKRLREAYSLRSGLSAFEAERECSKDVVFVIDELLALRAKLAAGPVMPVADLYALCEATTEQTYDSDNEFNRGRYFEAKHIAKAVMASGY